jgi:hypothetical protein
MPASSAAEALARGCSCPQRAFLLGRCYLYTQARACSFEPGKCWVHREARPGQRGGCRWCCCCCNPAPGLASEILSLLCAPRTDQRKRKWRRESQRSAPLAGGACVRRGVSAVDAAATAVLSPHAFQCCAWLCASLRLYILTPSRRACAEPHQGRQRRIRSCICKRLNRSSHPCPGHAPCTLSACAPARCRACARLVLGLIRTYSKKHGLTPRVHQVYKLQLCRMNIRTIENLENCVNLTVKTPAVNCRR